MRSHSGSTGQADVKVRAALDEGALRVTRLTGRAWGGNVEASGSAEARSHHIAVKLAASGVDVDALLKNVAGKDLLEGTGRVVADVSSNGASIGALRSNLAGTVALQVRNGAIKGVNLARAMRQVKAALSMKQDSVIHASATERTDFSEFTASARIAGGIAQSDDLDVKTPFLRIGGAGRFDIGRGRVDYTARASVIGSPSGQDGAEFAALRGLTVPVVLSGPFDAIDWKIQWSEVAAAAVEIKLQGDDRRKTRRHASLRCRCFGAGHVEGQTTGATQGLIEVGASGPSSPRPIHGSVGTTSRTLTSARLLSLTCMRGERRIC